MGFCLTRSTPAWVQRARFGRTADVAIAVLTAFGAAIGTVTPAAALSQGPNFPSTVVNEGTFPPDDPWQMPQQAAASDGSYAIYGPPADTGTTQYLKATGFGFSIPSNAVIIGIQVAVETHLILEISSGTLQTIAARIVKGGLVGATDRSGSGVDTPGVPDDVVTYGGSSDLWGETWTAADINAGTFGFAFRVFANTAIIFVDSISITVFYSTDCGNSQIDLGEDCDDGNTANGDCCSSTCHFDAPGTPCADATVCNGGETCDGAGTCLPGTPLDCDDHNLCTHDSCNPISGCVNDGSPVGGCRTALKSILALKNKPPAEKDKLVWKWKKGQATTQAEFGVPTGTTQYALCIYTGSTAALVADFAVPGDSMKWSPISGKGYKYKDVSGSADGITKVILKGNVQGKATCLVKGQAIHPDDLDLTQLVDPVTVQLVNDATSACFESRFEQADFITFDDPAQFKAKAQ
jgi:cysteine-rich repeat protein